VLDEDTESARSLGGVLQESGVETATFARSAAFADGMTRRTPDLVFLDVTAEAKQAIDAVFILGEHAYGGPVQLMGGDAIKVMDTVKNMGERHALNMLPVLRKPLEAASVRQVLKTQGLGSAAVLDSGIDLAEALANRWVEFWYQPKIDLRRKQIAGVESFPRISHPERGVLPFEPAAADADEISITRLTECALIAALASSARLAALGINLRLAVDASAAAFAHLPIVELVKHHAPARANWAGLIIDITEAHIATDLTRIATAASRLVGSNVSLAVDHFGHAALPATDLRALPLVEIKIDRAFAADCAGEPARASACKAMIEFAHGLGCTAVAMGVERAIDVHLLRDLGCDLGQGFLFGQPMPEDRLLALLRERAVSPRRAPALLRAADCA
jgi:EAL domain-containing protein (putative c-di-GMP-specific phosphodiesterase class I)